MARHRRLVVYLVACLIAIGSTLRYLGYYLGHPSRWAIFALLAAFYALLALAPWASRRSRLVMHLYLALQTCLLVALARVTTIEDVVALPFLALILLAMTAFPPKIGFRWIGVFVVLMLGSMIVYGITFHGMDPEMILFTALVYVAGYLGMGILVSMARQVEIARNEAEAAHAELQVAHEQLQAYTEQAEELAVSAERNRLARELHDSITQSLHSSTLMAEAAQRLAGNGDLERTQHYLGRLKEISQQALKEMRLMVYELRPLALRQVGLVGALQQRLDAVERRAGVDARLVVVGGDAREGQEVGLPAAVEEALYRIAQEALNNALKHAQPSTVTVTLRLEDRVELEVADDGSGFNPAIPGAGAGAGDDNAVRGAGSDNAVRGAGIGLSSMRERADKVGGALTIHSSPGKGTCVRAIIG